MAQLKFSRQRQALIEELAGRRDHPTAEMLYTKLKGTMPHLSLGTVYRNLSTLAQDGEILRIHTGTTDRFDAVTREHDHFCCEQCGRFLDLEKDIGGHLNAQAEALCGVRVAHHSLVFYGTCCQCQTNR